MKKKLLVFAALLILALACTSIALAKDVPEGAWVTRGELDDITSIAGNDIIDYDVDWYETCTGAGRVHYNVNIGTDTVVYYVYIKPHGHTMSSENDPEWGRVTKPATCSETGEAIDVCVCDKCDCDYEDPNHVRIIDKKPHEYDMTDDAYLNGHAELVQEPTCKKDGEGKAWRTCVYCGTRMPKQDDNSHLVTVDKIPHEWSDWRVDEDSSCLTYGRAARTCIRCSYVQYLDVAHPVVDQGETIVIGDVLPLKNPLWNTDLDGEEYDRQLDLENALEAEGFEYKLKKNWLKDCYTRELTYTCPYCNGTEHNDFTVTLVKPATIAHVWNEEPDETDSVAPTCTEAGYDIFYCKYDDDHGHTEEDQWYKVDLPALGHDWTEWYPADMFEKDGETYLVYFRGCTRCEAIEQKTEKYEEPEVKQGLVKDEDGVWRYYIYGEVATDVTKLVPFQGGEFWVVNGVVPNGANGLTICPDGKAYFLAQGQIQRVTQWAEYNGEWFILKNGELANVTGLQPYDGSWFAVESGRKLHVSGLWQDPNSGVWVFLADGQLQNYTGEVTYDGATFNVVKGYLVD